MMQCGLRDYVMIISSCYLACVLGTRYAALGFTSALCAVGGSVCGGSATGGEQRARGHFPPDRGSNPGIWTSRRGQPRCRQRSIRGLMRGGSRHRESGCQLVALLELRVRTFSCTSMHCSLQGAPRQGMGVDFHVGTWPH